MPPKSKTDTQAPGADQVQAADLPSIATPSALNVRALQPVRHNGTLYAPDDEFVADYDAAEALHWGGFVELVSEAEQ